METVKAHRHSILGRRTQGEKVFSGFNVCLMVLLLLLVFFPFWYAIVHSFDTPSGAALGNFSLLPNQFTFNNYYVFLKDPKIFSAFGMTFLRTIVGTVTSVFFTAMVAYGLSKRYLIGRKFFLTIGTITLVFSAGMIPSYFVVQSLGLLNSFWVYIIPGLFSFYNALIFMTFFRGLPASMEESASIDGANDFVIFLRIVVPLSMPVIATIALFNGVGAYNDYFSTMLYISQNHQGLYTIQYYLLQVIQQTQAIGMMKNLPPAMQIMMSSKTSPEALKYAAMLITALPMMCVYPFLQKYFVKGVMIGSIKG